MRAPLLSLTAAAALAVTAAACFDWDGLLSRCQQAGNCLPPGGADGGDAGDGGSDAGSDGGDGGSRGDAGRGQTCSGNPDCTSGACSAGGFCTCVVNGPCHGDQDCCLGQTCLLGAPVGSCSIEALAGCSGPTSGCTQGGPSICCSTCNGAMMCDCSPNGVRCNTKDDCCSGTAQCSAGKYCCEPPLMPCTMDDQCCSRVCRNNACQ